MVKNGQPVKYVDEVGKEHDALVTVVWSPTCVNVVFVNPDETMGDTYGRQIKRDTSVIHASTTGRAHGRFFFVSSIDEQPGT